MNYHPFTPSLEDKPLEWKPAGQPEHASLNQCQLIAANRCSGHPQLVVEIRFLCNVIDARALIGPCSPRRGHSGTEGGRTCVTYFAEEGVFFKTSACPRFCKRRVLFCTQVRSMGVKIPLQSTKYTRL